MRIGFATFVSILLMSSSAWAAPAGSGDADAAANRGQQGGTTVYDFDDDNVDGELLSPEGANISSRGGAKHASLITIRPHFIPELIRMANDV